MESQRERVAAEDPRTDEPGDADGPAVSVHRTSKERVVFTEAENKDGWIATDLAVELWR